MRVSSEEIRLRLRRSGIGPDKWLGQHFLIDEAIFETIRTTAKAFLGTKDTILEIGPGIGNLTDALLKLGHPVIAVEKDPVLAQKLPAFLVDPGKLTVIQGDILQALERTDQLSLPSNWCVIANIPYAISSPLIRKLLYRHTPPHHILVLVQKEMAERITAKPGDARRGLLTVEREIMAEANILMTVAPEAFWPRPTVESALLLFKLRPESLVPLQDILAVLQVVQAGFSSKRKQLHNSLAGGLGRNKSELTHVLNQTGIDSVRRAETLSLSEWMRLTTALKPGV